MRQVRERDRQTDRQTDRDRQVLYLDIGSSQEAVELLGLIRAA